MGCEGGLLGKTSLDKCSEFKFSYLHLLVAYGETAHANHISGMDDDRIGKDLRNCHSA